MAKWSTGISLSVTGLDMAVLRHRKGGAEVVRSQHEEVDNAQGESPESLRPALEKILGALKEWRGWRFVPIHVALPDPVIRAYLFHFSDVPGSTGALNQLVGWRMAREYGLDREDYVFSFQRLAKEEAFAPVLGVGATRSWVDMIRETFRKASMFPAVIDGGMLNRIHWARNRVEPNASWLYLGQDYWSFGLWGEDKGPRYLHSGWRWKDDSLEKLSAYLAGNAEQAIKAQNLTNPEISPHLVYLTAEEREVRALESQLKYREVPETAPLLFQDLPLNRGQSGGDAITARAMAERR